MSKQCNKNKKAHLYASGGMDVGGMALGTMQFVDGLASYKKEREANEELYNNAIDNTRIGFNGLSSINNLDDLESQLGNYNQLHEIGTSDLIGNDANRLGKYLSVSSQAAQAGGASGNAFGFLAGSIIGQLGAGWMSKRNKKKAEEAVADINQRVKDTNELYTSMANNRLNNIMQNQMSENQWNYIAALGGNLHSNSTTWDNGLNYIGNGGSHESNPNDGVAISTAPDGLENKVEEGEVVWNNEYVFSKRLTIPEKDKKANKWKGKTYADVAKKLMEDSEERPNDPITLRGLDDSLSRLRDSQDELKAKQEERKIKKEIASMLPEMLVQLQQQAQQPTEEEVAQQAAMEQQQMPMVDPSMPQPMMEQPPMYAVGGLLKKKSVPVSNEPPYPSKEEFKDYAAKQGFNSDSTIYRHNPQNLRGVMEHNGVPADSIPVWSSSINRELSNIAANKRIDKYGNVIDGTIDDNGEINIKAKGGHLFGGPWGSSLIERTGPIWEDVQEKPVGRQSGFQLNPNGTTLGPTTLDRNTAFDSVGNNIAANSNGINNHTLGVELNTPTGNGTKTTTTNAGASNGINKGAMFQGIAQGIDMIGAGFQSAGYKGGDLNALYKGTKHNDMFGDRMHKAMNGYLNIGLMPSMFAKGGHLHADGNPLLRSNLSENEYPIYLLNTENEHPNVMTFNDYVNYVNEHPIVTSNDSLSFTKSLDDITGSRRASNAGRTWQLLSDARKLKMVENAAERKEKIKNAKNKTRSALSNLDETSLRYAPVLGSIFNVARSIANRPDYGNPERIERAAARVGAPVSSKYIGDYLQYRPLDESYYLNQLNAQQNAANNTIVGLSNGNRSMVLASMLANDYNYNTQRGNAYRQGLEYNDVNRLRFGEFNRGTNQFNAQQHLSAAAQNAQNRAQAANLIASAAQMREGIDNAYGASQSANWTSLFNNLGAVGKDAANKKMTEDLFDYGWGKGFNKTYNGAPFKRGGYLTIKTKNRRKE